jgi:hypothetical protein
MLARKRLTLLFVGLCGFVVLVSDRAIGQNVRYYEENGMQIKETRTLVKRPIVERTVEQRQRMVYREQVTTELQPTYRMVHTPVTTYRWKARWHDVLNPFRPVRYDLVPQTHWQAHTEQVDVPIVRRQYVPQREVVSVPVSKRRFVNDEIIRKTVVSTLPGSTGSNGVAIARRGVAIGGVEKLENDPPRTSENNAPGSFR